jgi:hypothetical protein
MRLSNSRQRGFWLRCFLGTTVSICLARAIVGDLALAQLDIQKPLRLGSASGYVTDEVGKAVPAARIRLTRGGETVFQTYTDQEGWFEIRGAHGEFWLEVDTAAYSEWSRQARIGLGLRLFAPGRDVFVMLRRGACSDCTDLAFTSKKQFFKAIWWNTGHYN